MLTLQKPHIPASFNMYLVFNKCITAAIHSKFSRHYLRNRSTLDIGVLGYIGVTVDSIVFFSIQIFDLIFYS